MEEIVVEGWSFNPPPYWPRPPVGWSPSPSWQPDPAWGPVPAGWQLWVRESHGYRRPTAAATAGLAALLAIGVVGMLIPRAGAVDGVRVATGYGQPAFVLPPQEADPTRLLADLSPNPVSVPLRDLGPTVAPSAGRAGSAGKAATKSSAATRVFASCVALNAVYPHGVGLPDALDHTDDGAPPVVDFGRSTSLYGANAARDSDGDGIACEHR